jgi:hypothetical protein
LPLRNKRANRKSEPPIWILRPVIMIRKSRRQYPGCAW